MLMSFYTMFSHTCTHAKLIRLICILLIFILLTAFLFMSDSFINKTYSHGPEPCILCPYKKNSTLKTNAELLHFGIFLTDSDHHNPIDVMVFFVHAHSNPNLRTKLNRSLSSLFNYSTSNLHLHVMTDPGSTNYAVQVLKECAPFVKTSVKVTLHDVNAFIQPLQELINTLRPHFSYKQGAYYSDGLFYLSIGLFKVMSLKKLILIDADVKFLDDIKFLHNYFSNFSTSALIGIAREQQPVYRHVLNAYRRKHNSTKIGGPPPDGVSGFNSGVLLLDLEKMRNSSLYLNIVNNSSIILELVEKYKFKGHLGDQDFYSLISFDYPTLFYTLPCTWNRQLCQWWKNHGYSNVFNLYYLCTGKVHLLHGNCNTAIADS